ncbi:tripartite tricarboxylate transporter TctB family protein [Bacillus swezeyi]|uniref:Tripartite tricarboxylate transporter TctB family protein n=1 Tax=Bacillus swezeyi TaxID=1925020 RepID=A0A5M8RZP3_9BACI|nr:tripartite tricarboxylate transporter TctB family protein [Bacillus swezeyi]KAA6453299.1 tripartite tricarboxylate transporter TctB family protein [Bacillus swezeyi]KAA6476083.1 tripartite tricarboxylate transporter TctB family protein [Bacillus swezeyi]TYS38673.1 tripartite tricarboxylate transporter TctB family protein [Bacillus swezeyi]
MRITNRVVSVVILAVAAIYLALSFNLDSYPYAVIDADVLPKSLGILLLILGIFLFFEKDQKDTNVKKLFQLKKKDVKVMILCVVSLLIYITILEMAGFLLSTIILLIVLPAILGYRKWKTAIVVSLIFTSTIYFSFHYLLNIMLPQGILPF